MLIPPRILKKYLSVEPKGVLHIGAHRGEERTWYRREGFGPVVWVEAQAALAQELRGIVQQEGDLVIEACAWGQTGIPMTLNISNNGESSSVYEMGTHKEHHPGIRFVEEIRLETTALEEVLPSDRAFDFVNLDIQGAELEALIGLGPRLRDVSWVYTEVNRESVYLGIPLVGDLDKWLRKRGFFRVSTAWTPFKWGDALYMRRPAIFSLNWLRIAVGSLKIQVWFRSYPLRRLRKDASKRRKTKLSRSGQ